MEYDVNAEMQYPHIPTIAKCIICAAEFETTFDGDDVCGDCIEHTCDDCGVFLAMDERQKYGTLCESCMND